MLMCVMLYAALLTILYFCSSCLQLLPVALKYYDTHSNVDSNVAGIESFLLEIQKFEKNMCGLVKQFETQLHDHYKYVGSIFTDHVLGVDVKVTKCCETLASNLSSASSSVAVNVVQELENNKRLKKNVLFFTFLSQMHQIWRLIIIMFPSFVRIHLILTLKF